MSAARPVLVVEDDPITRQTFHDILVAEGYAVEVAVDAESGLAAIAVSPPAAVLLDLRLPLADGLEFLRRLRAVAANAAIPVAVVTGDYLIDEHLANAINAHGARICFKPLWQEDLIEVVERLLPLARTAASERLDRPPESTGRSR